MISYNTSIQCAVEHTYFDMQSLKPDLQDPSCPHQSPISASHLLGLLPLLLTLGSLIPELFQEILQGRHYTSRLEGIVLLVVLSTGLATRHLQVKLLQFSTHVSIQNHDIVATFIFTKCLLHECLTIFYTPKSGPLQAMALVTKPRFEPSSVFGQSPRLLPNPNSSANDPIAPRRPATKNKSKRPVDDPQDASQVGKFGRNIRNLSKSLVDSCHIVPSQKKST